VARPRKFDEAEVMRSVREQFWRAGYAATSVDDLGAVSGLGKGSLYGAFGDKHALFVRALDEYCDEVFGAAAAELLRGQAPAHERLATFVRCLAAGIAGDADRRGCLMARSAAELGSVDEDVAQRTARALTVLHSALTGCIAEAQEDGSLDRTADPAGLASLVLAVVRGAEALGKANAPADMVLQAAEQAIALLPRGPGN
jgi:TetR/AcrR family transcriptional regulator, transcriptional repressor for nem operon